MRYEQIKYSALLSLIGIILSVMVCTSFLTGCVKENKKETQYESNKTTIEETIEKVEIVKESTETHSIGQETIDREEGLPLDVFPLEFTFSSGVGAWRTTMTLNSDGSFEGIYSDSDMGTRGTDYPNGTVYICKFRGQFDEIQQINDYTYSMTLKEIITQNGDSEEWIENDIRYVVSDPYGMEDGREFLFYTPETPIDKLSMEFLSWQPYNELWEKSMETLSCYGIYNREMKYGFFTNE